MAAEPPSDSVNVRYVDKILDIYCLLSTRKSVQAVMMLLQRLPKAMDLGVEEMMFF